MKFFKIFLFYLLSINIPKTLSFVTNANFVIKSEQAIFNELLEYHNLPCHSQSSRVKSFDSAIEKMNKIQKNNEEINKQNIINQENNGYIPKPIDQHINNIYDLYDLIAFRFVFYNKEDLLKFYHRIKLEKTVYYTRNYIIKPKENGYSSIHIRYKNDYTICPVKQLECQLYIIEDYYEAVYGKARYNKNYTIFF
jgi:ppGpp synthetase/RelA/SpoT-type nucleotidyltranferase